MPQAKLKEEAGLVSDPSNEQWLAIERAAMAAGIIRSALSGDFPKSQSMICPALKIRKDGTIEALTEGPDGLEPMFGKWPNRFAQLAFGFVVDHLESSAPDLLKEIRERKDEMILGPFSLPIRPGVGFEQGSEPSKKGASALLALCKRMAATPEWLMKELERMERSALAEESAKLRAGDPQANEEPSGFLDRPSLPRVK